MTFGTRPLDLVFFIFFITHIPITLFFDLQVLYPTWLIPSTLRDIMSSYVQITKDPFMDTSNCLFWFQALVSMEALYQLPFFFVASYGLYHNSPSIRLPLIVYGAHVVTTVIPVMAELLRNPDYGQEMKRYMLFALYSPYLLIPLLILIDSYYRVSTLLVATKVKSN